MATTFTDLNLNKPLLNALADMGYQRPTTIQERSFSVMMSGRDVVGIAQTGTGKTLAYLLPCLRQWQFSKDRIPTILILVPTRELVIQVAAEAGKLAAYTNAVIIPVYGGTNIKHQVNTILEGGDIIVATPGRLQELVMTGALKLKSIKKLVIDEVDEMLNLGFRQQLTNILDLLPKRRQNLLFSATLTDEVEALITEFFNSPERIEAAPAGTPVEKVSQKGYHVPNFHTKINLLKYLLDKDPGLSKVLVFTATKQLADDVYEQMVESFPDEVGVIHSNKDQNARFNAVTSFQDGLYRALIATDIIARGLDIEGVTHVINFDIPEAPESYIHRIGRTGRADRNGIAISFITDRDDESVAAIEALMNRSISIEPLPSGLAISDILTEEEKPKVHMKEIRAKRPKQDLSGPSFHEKKEKNKKVQRKVTQAEQMRLKYGKPKTRGDKGQRKK